MMDREELRDQIRQRYLAGEAMDGTSAEDIGHGLIDPVEQINYVTNRRGDRAGLSPDSQDSQNSGASIMFWLVLIGLFVLCLLSSLVKLVF